MKHRVWTTACVALVLALFCACSAVELSEVLPVDELPAEAVIPKEAETQAEELPVYSVGQSQGEEAEVKEYPHALSYTTFFINSTYLLSTEDFQWADQFYFDIIQVKDMDDTELQEKINANILEAMTHWLDIFEPSFAIGFYPSARITIHMQSERFLSFHRDFGLIGRRADSLIDVITINMLTGERVMLNDLVEVNTAFAEKILETRGSPTMWGFPEIMENPEFLLERLHFASMDNVEIYEHVDEGGVMLRTGGLMFKTSFYVMENRLIITFHQAGGLFICEIPHVVFYLDDIEEFLKVEKW